MDALTKRDMLMVPAAPDTLERDNPLAWRDQGACRDADPELFFPAKGASNRDALALCAVCPVRAACLEWAVTHHEDGVWGGTSPRQRREIRKARGARQRTKSTVTFPTWQPEPEPGPVQRDGQPRAGFGWTDTPYETLRARRTEAELETLVNQRLVDLARSRGQDAAVQLPPATEERSA